MALLYYTHNRKPRAFMQRLYARHRTMAEKLGQQWVAVVAEEFAPDDLVVPFNPEPTYADIYRRILAGLDMVAGDDRTPVYLVEDDVLYSLEHFSLPARMDCVTYNLHLAYMSRPGYYWHHHGAIALSQLFGTKLTMRVAFRTKLNECLEKRLACVEPAGTGYYTSTATTTVPNVDIRSGYNATWRTPDDANFLPSLPGWAPHAAVWARYCREVEDVE